MSALEKYKFLSLENVVEVREAIKWISGPHLDHEHGDVPAHRCCCTFTAGLGQFVKHEHLQVRAEALLDKFLHRGGDGSSEVEGYEGSWRRATVVEHLEKGQSDKTRWVVIQLVDPKVSLFLKINQRSSTSSCTPFPSRHTTCSCQFTFGHPLSEVNVCSCGIPSLPHADLSGLSCNSAAPPASFFIWTTPARRSEPWGFYT